MRPASKAYFCCSLRTGVIFLCLFDLIYAIAHIINDSESSQLLSPNAKFSRLLVVNLIMSIIPSMISLFALMVIASKKKLRCVFLTYGIIKVMN